MDRHFGVKEPQCRLLLAILKKGEEFANCGPLVREQRAQDSDCLGLNLSLTVYIQMAKKYMKRCSNFSQGKWLVWARMWRNWNACTLPVGT